VTPREIVTAAIEFHKPERLPIRFASLGVDDTFGVGVAAALGWSPSREGEDEWGCIWEKPDPDTGVVNMGQPRGHTLTDYSLMESWPWPDAHDPSRYEHIESALAQAGDRYVIVGCGFTLFERMHYLRGMENLFVDMYEFPDKVHELAERVLAFPVGVAQEIGKRFAGRVHGFAMTDDWGTQRQCFIRIEMWRRFFKDRYRRLFQAIHDAGMHAWMHSCGYVNDVVGEWIDVGLDVVNLQQPRALGIEEIGQRYRGKICFESLCDIQRTLPFATEQEIREEARLLLTHWGTPKGGFILSDYGDGRAIGVPDDRKRVMLRAFCELAAPEMLANIQ
jgi:uroporphyrinogen-III decarboxylase